MRKSHCREAEEVVSLLYRQEAHSPGKGMITGKIKDILQLLVAWSDVVIHLLSDTFLFELRILVVMSFPDYLFTCERI